VKLFCDVVKAQKGLTSEQRKGKGMTRPARSNRGEMGCGRIVVIPKGAGKKEKWPPNNKTLGLFLSLVEKDNSVPGATMKGGKGVEKIRQRRKKGRGSWISVLGSSDGRAKGKGAREKRKGGPGEKSWPHKDRKKDLLRRKKLGKSCNRGEGGRELN